MPLQEEENKENIEAEDDVQTFGDGVDIVNIEPFLRKTAGIYNNVFIPLLHVDAFLFNSQNSIRNGSQNNKKALKLFPRVHVNRNVKKRTFGHVRPTNIHFSLRISAVCSDS